MKDFDPTVKYDKHGKKKLVNPLGLVWGYARVSTVGQREDRQLDALEEYGVDSTKIFLDKQSGKSFNRPAYKKLIRVIRRGDIVVIKSIDRLGRNYSEIIEQFRLITQEIGCGIHVIDMPLLNTSGDPGDLINKFTTDMMLQVLSFVAQNERENTINRQREGIEAAKRRRKVRIGRPKKKMSFDFWEIFIMWKSGEYRTNDLYRYCHETWGTSNRTFFRRLHELDKRYGDFSPERLRELILDEEFFDGIDFAYERMEAGIDYWNPYVLNNPYKEAEMRKKRKQKREEMTEEEIHQEETELMRRIKERRQSEFKQTFNMDELEGLEYVVEEMPTKLIHRKPNTGPKSSVMNTHSKNSGIELGVTLIDESPIIPDIDDRIDPQEPMKTVIIL